MAGVDFANVHDSAHKVIRARPRQLVCLLRVGAPSAIGVGQHVQLQGEIDLRLDFGSRLVSGSIPEFKSLRSEFSQHAHTAWQVQTNGTDEEGGRGIADAYLKLN